MLDITSKKILDYLTKQLHEDNLIFVDEEMTHEAFPSIEIPEIKKILKRLSKSGYLLLDIFDGVDKYIVRGVYKDVTKFIKAPSSKIKNLCFQLGCPYNIKIIDLENVIYRELNDNFDIEISGLDNNRKNIQADIHVWSKQYGLKIVETAEAYNIIQLKDLLGYLSIKYSRIVSQPNSL